MDHSHPTMPDGPVTEYALAWPGASEPAASAMATPNACCAPGGGSTHELVWDRQRGGTVFWVSGQMYDHIARIEMDGSARYFAMPLGSLPHGMTFDSAGQLWVTFEGIGQLARIGSDGAVAETVDVRLHAAGMVEPFNTRPHGLGIAGDGALWFTGKRSNTVGRVDPVSRAVLHVGLPTIGAVPIYLSAGPDGNMWCTELGGSSIARITPEGAVTEFVIPTPNSRPIAILPGPDGRSMWFSEEAGRRIGRIDMAGAITEFPVPLTSSTSILAGLAFDTSGDLWVQQYVSPPPEGPTEDDYVVRFDRSIIEATGGDLTLVPMRYYKAPSQRTVMHRITQGPDGNIWFSELGLNRIGRIALA